MKETIEREVIFYGKDGKPVAKETKTRLENRAPLFNVEYMVRGKWQTTVKGVSDEARAMVRKYEDRRLTSHMGAVASFTTKDVGAILETAAKERLAISISITPLDRPGEDANAATKLQPVTITAIENAKYLLGKLYRPSTGSEGETVPRDCYQALFKGLKDLVERLGEEGLA